MSNLPQYTVFNGQQRLFQGSLSDVVLKVKKDLGRSQNNPYLIFSDETGKTIDFDFQGNEKDVAKRLNVFSSDATSAAPATGPGRPKLGVTSREVSLLPRQWEWLAAQPGGASSTLRELVEEARKKTVGGVSVKQAQERTYKFLSALAGDLPGYEEALRYLYRKDLKAFTAQMADWPRDLRSYAQELAKPVFA